MCDVGGANTENHKTKQSNNLTRGSGSKYFTTHPWVAHTGGYTKH